MLNSRATYYTNSALRTATIAVGAVAGVALVASYLYSASYGEGSFQPTAQFLYNGILFGGAFAWFITNALRWLQERLLRPWNHIIFGAAAIAAIVVGGRTALDIAIDAPNDSHETIYQAVLASSLLAAGAIAAISALQRPDTPDDSADQSLNGVMRHITEGPTPRRSVLHYVSRWTAILDVSRWTAILGGVIFAVARFASPTVIPAAVDITWITRYASTWRRSKSSSTALLSAAAIAVIAIHLAAIILFTEEPLYTTALVASALLMLVALATSAVSL